MPDLPTHAPRASERAAEALNSLSGTILAPLLVLAVAGLLWALRVDLQFVVGAFLVVNGGRLLAKRLHPQVTMVASTPPPEPRPLRKSFEGEKDPLDLLSQP